MPPRTMEAWMRTKWDRLQAEWPVVLPFPFTKEEIAAMADASLTDVTWTMVQRLEAESGGA